MSEASNLSAHTSLNENASPSGDVPFERNFNDHQPSALRVLRLLQTAFRILANLEVSIATVVGRMQHHAGGPNEDANAIDMTIGHGLGLRLGKKEPMRRRPNA